MKFQIDTIAKEIHVIEDCQFGELISAIEKFLPEWREYKLVSKTPHEFSNPIIITIKEEKPPVVDLSDVYVFKGPPFAWINDTVTSPDIQGYATCNADYITLDTVGLLNKGVYNFQY